MTSVDNVRKGIMRDSNSTYLPSTDYGHTKAKSLILCGPNPNPNKYLGFGYKGLVFCRNNG